MPSASPAVPADKLARWAKVLVAQESVQKREPAA